MAEAQQHDGGEVGAESPPDPAATDELQIVAGSDLRAILLSGGVYTHEMRKHLRPSATWESDGNRFTLTDAVVQGVLDLRDAAIAANLTFKGCQFQDELRLDGLQARSLRFTYCEIPNGISLADGRVREVLSIEDCAFGDAAIGASGLTAQYFNVTNCHCGRLDARDVQISRGLSLRKVVVESDVMGTVDLGDARIGGPIFVVGGCLLGDSLLLRGIKAESVWIEDSHVQGHVMHPGVDLDRAEIVGEVRVRSSFVAGGISLQKSSIGGLSLEGILEDRHTRYAAVDCRGAEFDGSVALGSTFGALEVSGSVDFASARVRGNFIIGAGAEFAPSGPGHDTAVCCDRALIDGDVRVDYGWSSEGPPPIPGMSLFGCKTGGGVAIGRRIVGDGLLLDGTKVSQSLKVDRGATLLRAVDLGAESVDLDGSFGTDEGGSEVAGVLLLDGAQVAKSLNVAGSLLGSLRMVDVSAETIRVSTEMRCLEAPANLAGAHAQALDITDLRGCAEAILERIRVDDLDLMGLEEVPMRLDLRDAEVGKLSIGCTKGKALSMDLDGAQIRAIQPSPEEVPVIDRYDLIARDATKHSPRAFMMLADVYRRGGYPWAATETLIENERRRRIGGSALARAWSWLQLHVTGYGYRSGRAFRWLFAFWILGSLILFLMRSQFVVPEGSSAVVPFRPELYLLDQLLPFLSTGQDVYTATGAAMWTVPALVVLGWVLFSAVAAGLASATRRGD
ncbi:hypothetical protein N865_19645 [Intrasporangium oryzae NRRL B-24470]|uniref:Oxidoreductase n=1 Tax=Intrasporangium oryzae NRRL B-24470 TaxID=1386089 RepID=W9G3Q3_9MICO|nr:hypothetical protein [Intrasporangium oryzae]EWS99936.1 hypothetical protein N865_19645 [Intrasporangium oryzae NRRL B-24470]